jgi:hypothetical protein
VNHMLRLARFALLIGLSTAIPVMVALDPPHKQDQNHQDPRNEKKTVEPAKKDNASKDNAGDERLDRRNSRMKERNREIDGLLNKKNK